jgi:Flp pilus assembly pilin Flp
VARTSRSGRRAARDRGSSTAEYGLMVAALAAGLVGVIFAAGRIASEATGGACSQLSVQLSAGGDCDSRQSSGAVPASL